MTKEITQMDLYQIWTRWDDLEKPVGVEDKAWKLTEKLNEKIYNILSLGNFDKKTAYELGKQAGAVITKPLLLCYYIGYELASGKMRHLDSSLYLSAATNPIDNFILELLEILIGNGLVTPEEGKDMAIEIAKLTGEASNNICILGIENYATVADKYEKQENTISDLEMYKIARDRLLPAMEEVALEHLAKRNALEKDTMTYVKKAVKERDHNVVIKRAFFFLLVLIVVTIILSFSK